jgi:putative protein-disulfide isomerase
MNLTLIYCYDAYCGWCYGFSNIMQQVFKKHKTNFYFEVLSGGMVLPEKPVPIANTASYIKSASRRVEDLTGVKFGEDYLWHINNPDKSDWFPNSEKAAIALCIVKEIYPEKQIAFASDLQYALHFEGRDLTDDEAYKHLLEKYKIDPNFFYEKLKSEEYKDKAHYEFSLCKQLKVTGFPMVFIQSNESKFYLVAKGYTSFENVDGRIQNILQEINQ